MSSIKVNGFTITSSGNSVCVTNGRVVIDGKDVTPEKEKVINICVTGDVENVRADVCDSIIVSGNAKTVGTTSGDVTVEGDVQGNVKTVSGDVQCKAVGEGVETVSGDVHCGDVRGNVSSINGDVRRKN